MKIQQKTPRELLRETLERNKQQLEQLPNWVRKAISTKHIFSIMPTDDNRIMKKPFSNSNEEIDQAVAALTNSDYSKARICELMAGMLFNTHPAICAALSLMKVLNKINELCILLNIDTEKLTDDIEGLLDSIKTEILKLQTKNKKLEEIQEDPEVPENETRNSKIKFIRDKKDKFTYSCPNLHNAYAEITISQSDPHDFNLIQLELDSWFSNGMSTKSTVSFNTFDEFKKFKIIMDSAFDEFYNENEQSFE